MVQMPNVDDIGPKFVEDFTEAGVDPYAAVAIAAAGNVDEVELDASVVGIALGGHRIVGKKWVLCTGEDTDIVSHGERVAERLRIDLGPGVEPHRVAVDDLKDAHAG